MSKTQQVKQYKKQIDQLSSEAATYKQQASDHRSQVHTCACTDGTCTDDTCTITVCVCVYSEHFMLAIVRNRLVCNPLCTLYMY